MKMVLLSSVNAWSPATDISRAVFSSHGTAMSSLSEKDLLEAISTCCVTKQTLQARNAVLYRIKQDAGQTVQAFLAALKQKARQCEMKVKCEKAGCDQENDYSTNVIMNLFIMGLADMKLQQDIMSEKNSTLDRAVSIS